MQPNEDGSKALNPLGALIDSTRRRSPLLHDPASACPGVLPLEHSPETLNLLDRLRRQSTPSPRLGSRDTRMSIEHLQPSPDQERRLDSLRHKISGVRVHIDQIKHASARDARPLDRLTATMNMVREVYGTLDRRTVLKLVMPNGSGGSRRLLEEVCILFLEYSTVC